MAENSASMPLGQRMTSLDGLKLGLETWFPDLDYTRPGVKPQLSAQRIRAVLARLAVGSTAIVPGANVVFDVPNTVFDAVAASAVVANGQLDPYLSSNAVAGDICWIILEGPTLINAGGTIAAGVSIKTGAAGVAVTNDYSSNGHTAYGMTMEAAAVNQKKRAYVQYQTR